MKYLVMECHPGYAIVLDNDGRFIKAANMNYEVGQTLYSITEFVEMPAEHIIDNIYDVDNTPDITVDNKNDVTSEHKMSKILSLKNHRKLYNFIASAACICLIALNSWYFVFMTYATVEVKINPDVLIYVNSLDYVKNIRSLNSDGDAILEDYSYKGKKLSDVSLELTKAANAKGYLENNNDISIVVRSKHNKWAEKAELKLNNNMDSYLKDINREDINFSFTYLDTDELEDISVIEETESTPESSVPATESTEHTKPTEPTAIPTTAPETTSATHTHAIVSEEDDEDDVEDKNGDVDGEEVKDSLDDVGEDEEDDEDDGNDQGNSDMDSDDADNEDNDDDYEDDGDDENYDDDGDLDRDDDD